MLIKVWEAMVNHLLIENKEVNRVLLVKYEDLVKNTEIEVVRMLRFLGLYIPLEQLEERLKTEFATFKRNHRKASFEHFTTTQKQLINGAIRTVSSRLNSRLLPLQEYTRSLT